MYIHSAVDISFLKGVFSGFLYIFEVQWLLILFFSDPNQSIKVKQDASPPIQWPFEFWPGLQNLDE